MLQFMGSQNSVQVLGGAGRHRHKTALQYLAVRYIQLPMIYVYKSTPPICCKRRKNEQTRGMDPISSFLNTVFAAVQLLFVPMHAAHLWVPGTDIFFLSIFSFQNIVLVVAKLCGGRRSGNEYI